MPTLLVIGGLPGTGKTQIGKAVARQTGWPIFDKDTVTRPLVELALSLYSDSEGPNDRHSPRYQNSVRVIEYECMLKVAEENLDQGLSMILSAPFAWEMDSGTWVKQMKEVADFFSYPTATFVLWITCAPDTAHSRLVDRDAPRDYWKLRNWENYLAQADHYRVPRWADLHIENNGVHSVDTLSEEVLKSINAASKHS
jgi:predicted kinase